MTSRLERYAPFAAVVFAVLGVIATILTVPDSPDWDAPGREILAYYGDKHDEVQAGAYLYAIAVAFLLWFLGSLRSFLLRAEAGTQRLTALAYGAGVATCALLWASNAPSLSAALRADDGQLTPDSALVMWDIGTFLYVMALFACAVLLVATGLHALRTGVLPRWLAWASFAIAVGLVTPIGFALFLAFVVWTVVVAVLIDRADRVVGGTTAAAAPPVDPARTAPPGGTPM